MRILAIETSGPRGGIALAETATGGESAFGNRQSDETLQAPAPESRIPNPESRLSS